jgi:pimeloyl-ACP methyl ester carboxylesterase
MTAPHDHIIQTRNGAVTTRALVAGSGPPVLYLHGMEGLEWNPLLDELADRHTVYAIEHVGSGESTGLEELHDFWDLVVHYEEVLYDLGLERTAIVGHSFGGMVAAEVAAHLRDRVTRLVLMAPLGLWDDDHPVAEIDAISRGKRAEVLLADPSRPLPRLIQPDIDDHEALFRADVNAASINQFTWPIPEKGLVRRLYRIMAPTLLLWGAEDRIVEPVYADAFAAQLRAPSTVTVIPELGHLLHLERHEPCLPHVVAHLSS